MQPSITTIVLAAGRGERMHSATPKALHALCGRPLLDWVLRAAEEAGAVATNVPIAVVSEEHQAALQKYFGERLRYAVQREPDGAGGALRIAADALRGDLSERALVLLSDTPLLKGVSIRGLLSAKTPAAALCTPSCGDQWEDIQEEVLLGCCFTTSILLEALELLKGEARQGELTLSDILRACTKGSAPTFVKISEDEAADINDRVQLQDCTKELRRRINYAHMQNGVTLIDAQAAYIDATVTIERDCVIYPGVVLEGQTAIGEGTVLYPGCRIKDSAIGRLCTAQAVVASDAVVGDGVSMGPFVNLRPGTRIADNCKIGNYIEVKNSNVGEGSKLPHLSYIGDGDVGKHVNLGCGTVFVNYDGHKKHRTKIGDHAFIGCHTSLVAPVSVGEGSFTAAGSVITQDVPPDTLAVARAKQENKIGYMVKIRQRRT